jgi:cobalt-zinc-cadmium efflux system membrane fusion protein
MMPVRTLLLATFIAFPAWAGGDASDGHTHAPAPAPTNVVSSPATPRATGATEDFELVAVLDGNHLLLYVDRFASNEPVAKAKVEVEGAGQKVGAGETAPGTYVADLAAPLPAGRHGLTISIETDDSADLMAVTLDTSLATSLPVTITVAAPDWGQRIGWSIAALLLAAGALLIVRRR